MNGFPSTRVAPLNGPLERCETILRLLEWSTSRLKRSRRRRFYITRLAPTAFETYLEKLRRVWHDLASTEFGVRREFVRIPDLRDAVCEALLIDATAFDRLFIKILHGYIPSKCDLKCYKCRYQGTCIIPRRLIGARRRYAFAIENKNLFLNRKYGRNSFGSMLLSLEDYRKIFRSLVAGFPYLTRKILRYRRKQKNGIFARR